MIAGSDFTEIFSKIEVVAELSRRDELLCTYIGAAVSYIKSDCNSYMTLTFEIEQLNNFLLDFTEYKNE